MLKFKWIKLKSGWFKKLFTPKKTFARPAIVSQQPEKSGKKTTASSVTTVIYENYVECARDDQRDNVLASAKKALLEMDPSRSSRQ
jgi:hypothetical protein